MYKLFIKKGAKKSLKNLPLPAIRKIAQAIDELAVDPFTYNPKIKKLRPPLIGYRYKIWPYRISYTVNEEKKEIIIYKIFNFISNMRNNLHGFPQIISFPFSI